MNIIDSVDLFTGLDQTAPLLDGGCRRYGEQIALVSITGASNVTGMINPIHSLAQKTDAVGALFATDCAQLAPHRRVEMLPLSDPAHLDFVAISAHKKVCTFWDWRPGRQARFYLPG